MLDSFSTSSYVTESAAHRLNLFGLAHNLVLSGTGGTEVKLRSHQVKLTVSSLEHSFEATLTASELRDIVVNTQAFEWSDLKTKWPPLQYVPFEETAKRQQIDLLIGSDHPIFH